MSGAARIRRWMSSVFPRWWVEVCVFCVAEAGGF
jgi:hypothetical protein